MTFNIIIYSRAVVLVFPLITTIQYNLEPGYMKSTTYSERLFHLYFNIFIDLYINHAERKVNGISIFVLPQRNILLFYVQEVVFPNFNFVKSEQVEFENCFNQRKLIETFAERFGFC